MAGDTSRSPLVPLTGTNYPTWKVQCKMALLKDNLWGIVTGTETEPRRPDQGGDEGTHKKFVVRRDKALAIIVLAVDPSLLYLIGDPEDPKDVWKKLQDQFQRKTWANKLALKRRLYALRLEDGEPVQDHIKSMTEIFSELAVVGDPVENEDQVVQLLASLPESFDMLVTALETSTEVPPMEIVVERLLHEEKKLQEKTSGQEKAMASKQKKGPRCFECNEFGHFRKECPLLSEESERDSKPKPKRDKRKKAKAYEAEVDYSSDDSVGFLAHSVLAASSADGWVIDSGATAHMCKSKELFRSFKVVSPSSVTVGDGKVLSSEGVGDVELLLKLPNGKTKKCVLNDVLYVPRLACNLFSVSMASKNGKVTIFDDTTCEILEGKKVVASGRRVRNLYILDCVSGQRALVASEGNEMLWHHKNGHLEQDSSKKLVRENMFEGIMYDPSEGDGFGEVCVHDDLYTVTLKKSKPDRGPGKIPVEECTGVIPRREGRASYPPSGHGKWAMVAGVGETELHARAMGRKERQALRKRDVWDSGKFPPGCTSIGQRQTCKVKMKDSTE